jgi:gamma-glutamylcyclotransferase
MIYFAYGSNLDARQMAQRCPGARATGTAQLAGHRLCFPRKSPVRDCAVASIEPAPGAVVWGVTYDLTSDDMKRLDAREGYDPTMPAERNRYNRVVVRVVRFRGETADAFTYIAVPEANPGVPSPSYLNQIATGAKAHGIPEDYINLIRAFGIPAAA